MKMFGCHILQIWHTAIDSSNMMDLSMITIEKVFHSWNKFQKDHNSELKQGSYSRLKLAWAKSMVAQWCWLQLKIGATSRELFKANHIWFWSLRSKKSSTSKGFQFGIEETREIWLIEAKLHKGHAITRWSSSQIIFGCLGSFFGHLFGLF